MSGVWTGRCEGCNDVHELVTLNLGTGGFTPALCVECEACLRLISADYDRLRYTLSQLLRKTPMEDLTGDLPRSAIEEISRVVAFARSTWKTEKESAVQSDMNEPQEKFIPNDLAQRIRTKLQNPNALSPNYATYNIRLEDKIILHSWGVQWSEQDQEQLPKPAKEEL